MTEEIKTFVKDEKTEAAMKEINQNPMLYTRIFTKIYNQLCRHCKAKVHRHFLNKNNTNFKEYCETCQKMAKEEYEKWTT